MVQWLIENWKEVTLVFAALLRLLESFAIVTKTNKDNKFIETIKEFFRFG